ncbi:ribulose-phosphate 3-epimerase [Thermodesulfovibrionales bacterium]|nr:ribulose-phosphate 3-epimerase [Thermodesulfovibrionales bacterium]
MAKGIKVNTSHGGRVIKIAPSILSGDFMRLGEEIRSAEAVGADLIHLDIMDGHFVPSITVGPAVVEAIRKTTSLSLDVHLMIEEPDKFLKDFAAAGADFLTVHVEASAHLHRTIHCIKESGIKAGASLSPATPLCSLEYILPDLDLVLLMSVNPGFGGQDFITSVLNKIRALKGMIAERGLNTAIEVDGGVKLSNVEEIASAGADILVMGSAFFNSGNYAEVMKRLKDLLRVKE